MVMVAMPPNIIFMLGTYFSPSITIARYILKAEKIYETISLFVKLLSEEEAVLPAAVDDEQHTYVHP